jgi:hypothetical protein
LVLPIHIPALGDLNRKDVDALQLSVEPLHLLLPALLEPVFVTEQLKKLAGEASQSEGDS